MSKDRRLEDDDAMDAIRALVESNRNSLAMMNDEVLELDDVVWRSPSRLAVDPTETISRLAEEADKVARGDVSSLPQATILREKCPHEAAGKRPRRATAPEPQPQEQRTDPRFELEQAETGIRALMKQALREQGKVDEEGRILVSEDELRAMVRAHIDQWLAQQSDAPAEDALHGPDDLR
ncbi:MAG: hypothetical protein VX556_02650 [Pseudomonadota bacterium]|nr:hypothetical protein [Pseudomonadota bacterium]